MEARALAELQLVSDELRDRRVSHALTSALATGGPAGTVGRVLTSGIRVQELNRAVALATQSSALAPLTARAQQLLATAQLIRRLRECLRVDDWVGAEQVFNSHDEMLVEPAPEGDAEFSLVADELHSREVLRDVARGIAHGRAFMDADGTMDLGKVRCGCSCHSWCRFVVPVAL